MKSRNTLFLILTAGLLSIQCGCGDEECEEVCGRVWECEDELVTEMTREEFSGVFGENQKQCKAGCREYDGLSEACLGCFDGSVPCGGLFACIAMYCGEGRPPGLPCDMDPPANLDPTAGVSFDSDHMPCVDLQMTPDDWAALKEDSRWGETGWEELHLECDDPWPNEYTWFEADLTVDGVSLDQVGIRKKGFVGSSFAPVPALKVKTDKYEDGQFLGDTERITLNNNAGDPTYMVTCLVYQIFDAAGYPAPQCNMASVMVNDQALGPYTHVEAIKKRFLLRAFGDDSGSLYEGAMTDFVEEWLPRWEIKTDDTDPSYAPLLGVAEALQASDDQLLAALEPVLNVDRFITFWALEILVLHMDGYAAGRNNFYVYFDPSDGHRAVFVPWGVDDAFQVDEIDEFVIAELPRRLSRLPETRNQLEDELARLMDEVWDEQALLQSIDRMEEQISSAQEPDEDYDEAVEDLRAWVRDRPARVADMLATKFPIGAQEQGSCD